MTPDSSAPSFRAVLFDLEEVLVPFQTLASWQWAWRPQGPLLGARHVQTVLRRGRRTWDRRRWQGLTGKLPPADALALTDHLSETLRAIAGRALPTPEAEAVVRRIQHPTGEVERFPDVASALSRLASTGVKVGAVSSLPAEHARWIARRAGLSEEIVLSAGDPPGPVAPDPAVLTAAVERLSVGTAETAFVGGLYWSDVRAANRVGLRGILVDRVGAWPSVQGGHLASLDGLEAAILAATAAPADDAAGPTDGG